jgi:transcriptional regulator of nitric oxide reductase
VCAGGERAGGIKRPRRGETKKADAASWEETLKLASSWLGLSFTEALRLTPYELKCRLEAADQERLQERRFTAAMFAGLMNLSGKYLKKPVTGDSLLGLDQNGKRLRRKKPVTKESLVEQSKKRKRTLADYLREHGGS